MAKISLDVEELKKNLKATAQTAKAQFRDMAKKAQKDFSQKEVLKKIDQVVDIVKSQEFFKNPRVVEISQKIMNLSEQLEKTVTKNAANLSKNANLIVEQVRESVGKGKKKKTAKTSGAKKPQPKKK
ncbi:MAG: hypothetical protein SGI74_14690 [Oligoflexia bacterium]|nr:hypothetical protein [Oligoflexia bacterium]